MRPNQCFFILENSNSTKDFNPCSFLVYEVLELGWCFVFTFLIKNDFLRSSCIIDFKNRSHIFFMVVEEGSNNNKLYAKIDKLRKNIKTYLINVVAVKLALVIWASSNVCDHFECHWHIKLILLWSSVIPTIFISTGSLRRKLVVAAIVESTLEVIIIWLEKSTAIICELNRKNQIKQFSLFLLTILFFK